MVYKNLEKDLPMMLCDEAQIKQVILNIILNALQVMDGEKELTIASQLNGERNEVGILIKDTGSGIPKGLRHKIFDPFFTTKSNGTGLGLSISYGIIQKHGGIIQVESATREDLDSSTDKRFGTTVTIKLPL